VSVVALAATGAKDTAANKYSVLHRKTRGLTEDPLETIDRAVFATGAHQGKFSVDGVLHS
jgi:hypothetical protein